MKLLKKLPQLQQTRSLCQRMKHQRVKKTADQVELAYKTGGETGLRYESVKVEPIKGMTDDMVRGVDISSYQSLLNAGVQFYDFNGQPASIFKVLSDAGVNWVRIRLWNDPYDKNGNGYGGGNNDEASLVKMASEAAQYGLKTLVDFHYSDFWADPAKQILPKAWSQLSDTDLAKEVNLYTKKVLADLKRAGADVQMVSIGNEITKGAFGQVANSSKGEDWKSIWLGDAGKRLTMLLSQASSAVRESGNSKIAIHIETPNVDKYRQIMTVLKNNGVDYDYLGTSYYPFWWNNSDTLRDVAHMTETEFGKRLVVMEVSWLNDTHDADGTGNSLSNDGGINKFPIGPQGQVDVLADMYKALVDTDGVGSFYWEPAWLPVHPGYENWQENKDAGNQYGTGWASKYAVGYAPDNEMYWEGKPTWGGTTWDNQSLFDDHGYPLQSLNMYKGFLHGYETPVNTKVSSTVTAKVGTVTDNPLTGVDVNNQTINLTGLISNAGQFLLQGQPNQVISDTQLQAIANELLTSGKSDLQTTANGDVYHLTYELTDANRTAFVKDNHGKHYGDTLNVSYTTQVVVDRQGSATTNQVTSPITVKVSEVWNAVNNYTPTVDGLLAVGDTLTDQDVDLAQINTKTLQTLLTGTKGETVTASYDQIKSLLPGATSALMGTKDYVTADGNHYRYEFWLKDLNQAGLKYGNPLVLSYSASLKWLSKD
ncbi:glycosyl hydrolase 53 family protein [Limosilactobacillus equigenerosi]|uniref:glycosyl hydrolase 53 family protein n=1 Tax=Limosilactobacillus equigenerosi TaxID=417373 RepID=UPI001CDAB4C1|nr:glycosyl hydrolase 53 family protein [Limosilactobacillus equigenerosi]